MKPFERFESTVVALRRANIDTDAIIPKEYLKSVERTGFGKGLFSDWRYLPDGSDNPDFKLNQPQYRSASILVAGTNFGCGSSREHAVWAIMQYGFRVVIAPSDFSKGERIPAFADIFRNNSSKNGLLLIELSKDEVEQISEAADAEAPLKAAVDLARQELVLKRVGGEVVFHFEIDATLKDRLLKGLDEIALTLQYEDDISDYEAHHKSYLGKE